MDETAARKILELVISAASNLEMSLFEAKARCSAESANAYGELVTPLLTHISNEVVAKIRKQHPSLLDNR